MCNGRWGAQLEVALDDVICMSNEIVIFSYLKGGGVQREVALDDVIVRS